MYWLWEEMIGYSNSSLSEYCNIVLPNNSLWSMSLGHMPPPQLNHDTMLLVTFITPSNRWTWRSGKQPWKCIKRKAIRNLGNEHQAFMLNHLDRPDDIGWRCVMSHDLFNNADHQLPSRHPDLSRASSLRLDSSWNSCFILSLYPSIQFYGVNI